MLRIICLLCVICYGVAAPKNGKSVVTRQLNTADEIISSGYAGETHQVITEDGYILKMHRIPFPRDVTSMNANRPVVFMMHGLLGASQNFVFMGPEHSIGYHLADAGFDVWMGNYRGNINSRNHVTLDPDDPVEHFEFFDFSWEEIALYDIPAMIDYVLDFTGKEKLHYIGHSQGGTVFLVLMSMRPEYNEKMASVNLLAGVGYQNYFPNTALRTLAMMTDIIYRLSLAMGLLEMTPAAIESLPIPFEGYSSSELCFGDPKYKYMCELVGAREIMRDDEISVGLDDAGFGGGSLKQIAHYGQNIRDRVFRRYNYGSNNNNLAVYNSTTPPEYDLGLITANVTMHYTLSDTLLDERDVLDMAEDMPNTVVRKVARDSFLHEDFIAAYDAKELVTDYIISLISEVHGPIIIESSMEEDTIDAGGEESVAQEPGVADGATNVTLNMILKTYLLICTVSVLYISSSV